MKVKTGFRFRKPGGNFKELVYDAKILSTKDALIGSIIMGFGAAYMYTHAFRNGVRSAVIAETGMLEELGALEYNKNEQ